MLANKIIVGAYISIAAIFMPIESILITMCVLVFSDLVLGIWAALKRGEKFQSAVLGHTVIKTMVYLIAVCLGYLVQHFIMKDIFPLTNMVAGIVGFVEFTSLLENSQDILGQPVFASLISTLKRRTADSVTPTVVITQQSSTVSQTVVQEENMMKRPPGE